MRSHVGNWYKRAYRISVRERKISRVKEVFEKESTAPIVVWMYDVEMRRNKVLAHSEIGEGVGSR